MSKSKGIIYYNFGQGCMPRLAVSIYSLRQSGYKGPVTIISDGEESGVLCKKLVKDKRLGVELSEPNVNVRSGKNHHYLAKCRLHEMTPYDVSLFIDSDTIVKGDLTPMWEAGENYEFAVPQFSNWLSTGRTIKRRILEWNSVKPREVKRALEPHPAVNTGVMSFVKDSMFMRDWFKVARRGRGFFIPDETSCQVILWNYPHHIMPYYYNASCRYDDCRAEEVKLIHYHGRKHCREGLPFHGDVWVEAYDEVVKENIGDIRSWTPATDRHLKKYLSLANG